jgi:6,7-dimethyl-8-ribityllumazine synthase
MREITADEQLHTPSFPIAIIVSQFNQDITDALKQGAVSRLTVRGIEARHMTLIEVPGAFEIPVIAKKLATSGRYNVIIALGAVIRGETTHYDYVCEQVSDGCAQVALKTGIPVIFGILTTENEQQAWDRLGGQHGHKGEDVADAAIAMHSILTKLNEAL